MVGCKVLRLAFLYVCPSAFFTKISGYKLHVGGCGSFSDVIVNTLSTSGGFEDDVMFHGTARHK